MIRVRACATRNVWQWCADHHSNFCRYGKSCSLLTPCILSKTTTVRWALRRSKVWLRWLIQVSTFHDGCKQGIDQQIFNRKSISRKITHPRSWKLQAKLTGEKLKGWSNSREKTQDYNQNLVTQAQKSYQLNKLIYAKNASCDKKTMINDIRKVFSQKIKLDVYSNK